MVGNSEDDAKTMAGSRQVAVVETAAIRQRRTAPIRTVEAERREIVAMVREGGGPLAAIDVMVEEMAEVETAAVVTVSVVAGASQRVLAASHLSADGRAAVDV